MARRPVRLCQRRGKYPNREELDRRMIVAPVRLGVVGDVMLGRLVNDFLATRPPEWCWGTALPLLRSADAVLANLECVLTDHLVPWTRTPKVFHFRANPAAVAVLRAGNVKFVSLANNHVLDYEEQGLLDTVRHLDGAAILHAGAGRDLAAARAPALLDLGPVILGILAITDNEPAFAAGPDSPGTCYHRIAEDADVAQELRARAAALRRAGADLVVLSAHWGPNMVSAPPPAFRAFARGLADDGTVDLFWGHSAHVFQGVERRGSGVILYDTGDFLDDYRTDPRLRNDWSFIFLIDLEGRRLARLRLVPVTLKLAQVNLAEGADAAAICLRMQAAAAQLGTRLTPTAEGLELPLPGTAPASS
jgi:poly-gamma-glutamate synthesis protein (capsule biosynthesis protein)